MFGGLPTGLVPSDFGIICLQWSVQRAEQLVNTILSITGFDETETDLSLVTRIARDPHQARQIFAALLIATYFTYIRVVMKVPREVLLSFKEAVAQNFGVAISQPGEQLSAESLKLMSLAISAFSLAIEEDLEESKETDSSVVDVKGSQGCESYDQGAA